MPAGPDDGFFDGIIRYAKTGWPHGATPCRAVRSSDWTDLLGLRALGAASRGVLHPLIVLEAAITVSLDGGVVHEDVGRAVVGGDETIALVRVEPLHCSLSHYFSY